MYLTHFTAVVLLAIVVVLSQSSAVDMERHRFFYRLQHITSYDEIFDYAEKGFFFFKFHNLASLPTFSSLPFACRGKVCGHDEERPQSSTRGEHQSIDAGQSESHC